MRIRIHIRIRLAIAASSLLLLAACGLVSVPGKTVGDSSMRVCSNPRKVSSCYSVAVFSPKPGVECIVVVATGVDCNWEDR